jgi:hypothetical protein
MRCIAMFSAVIAGLALACSSSEVSVPSTEDPQRSAYERGKQDALADLRAESPRYFLSCMPLDPDSQLRDILSRRYGVTLVLLGCAAPPPVADHANGYNEVILNAMHVRFGESIIDAAERENAEARQADTRSTNKPLQPAGSAGG